MIHMGLTSSIVYIDMDDTHGAYIHEDEIRGMDVCFGTEGTKSNGHGEGKDDNMNMVETIRNLQKDV
jgi:hypothetical protein